MHRVVLFTSLSALIPSDVWRRPICVIIAPYSAIRVVGSENSDHIFSGNSDHLGPAGARGRTPATQTRGGRKDVGHAEATRDSGAAPGGPQAEGGGQTHRRLAKQHTARRS